jgi:hypothetical protein
MPPPHFYQHPHPLPNPLLPVSLPFQSYQSPQHYPNQYSTLVDPTSLTSSSIYPLSPLPFSLSTPFNKLYPLTAGTPHSTAEIEQHFTKISPPPNPHQQEEDQTVSETPSRSFQVDNQLALPQGGNESIQTLTPTSFSLAQPDQPLPSEASLPSSPHDHFAWQKQQSIKSCSLSSSPLTPLNEDLPILPISKKEVPPAPASVKEKRKRVQLEKDRGEDGKEAQKSAELAQEVADAYNFAITSNIVPTSQASPLRVREPKKKRSITDKSKHQAVPSSSHPAPLLKVPLLRRTKDRPSQSVHASASSSFHSPTMEPLRSRPYLTKPHYCPADLLTDVVGKQVDGLAKIIDWPQFGWKTVEPTLVKQRHDSNEVFNLLENVGIYFIKLLSKFLSSLSSLLFAFDGWQTLPTLSCWKMPR